MAWRVMILKKIPTMFSHKQLAGVKCSVIRWFSGFASHSGFGVPMPAVVVQHDVQVSGWRRAYRALCTPRHGVLSCSGVWS